MVPKAVLDGLLAFGLAKLGWFRRLKASNRNIRLCPSLIRNCREIPASNEVNPGPVMVLRPEVPNVPGGSTMNALGLNAHPIDPTENPLAQGGPLNGVPTISARSCLMPVREPSVPPSTE